MSIELISIVVLFVLFFGLLAYGVPVAYSIGISTTVTLLLNIAFLPGITTVCQRMTIGIDSFALLAIPFFILAGELMNRGGYCQSANPVRQIPGGKPTWRAGLRQCSSGHVVWCHFGLGRCGCLGHR